MNSTERLQMTESILVQENGQTITYSFDDVTKYHGFGFPGGVGHAFRVLQRALPLLSPDMPAERREIVIRTPFKGPGARDAFEMVTRAVTEGHYTIDDSLLALERGETLKGYVFILSYRGTELKLTIRDGIVLEEFILLGRNQGRSAAEDERLAALKQDMAARLLARTAEDCYDVEILNRAG